VEERPIIEDLIMRSISTRISEQADNINKKFTINVTK
jgi:hypothetical protein